MQLRKKLMNALQFINFCKQISNWLRTLHKFWYFELFGYVIFNSNLIDLFSKRSKIESSSWCIIDCFRGIFGNFSELITYQFKNTILPFYDVIIFVAKTRQEKAWNRRIFFLNSWVNLHGYKSRIQCEELDHIS